MNTMARRSEKLRLVLLPGDASGHEIDAAFRALLGLPEDTDLDALGDMTIGEIVELSEKNPGELPRRSDLGTNLEG
jgi:hypothetical protein